MKKIKDSFKLKKAKFYYFREHFIFSLMKELEGDKYQYSSNNILPCPIIVNIQGKPTKKKIEDQLYIQIRKIIYDNILIPELKDSEGSLKESLTRIIKASKTIFTIEKNKKNIKKFAEKYPLEYEAILAETGNVNEENNK